MILSAGSTYYAWNAAGQMFSAEPAAEIVSFTYNADGQRVAKQGIDGSVTSFLYDGEATPAA